VIGEEAQLRHELRTLAASPRGRRLLQMAVRGMGRGEREVTAGCWREKGNAGCLFQHAYWEGVKEGVFTDHGRPGDWIGSFVGAHDYGVVINVIAAFDRLARTAYADVEHRRWAPDRIAIRQRDWHAAVEEVVVSVLSETETSPAGREAQPAQAGQLTHMCSPAVN
jgi:hypothetical protein